MPQRPAYGYKDTTHGAACGSTVLLVGNRVRFPTCRPTPPVIPSLPLTHYPTTLLPYYCYCLIYIYIQGTKQMLLSKVTYSEYICQKTTIYLCRYRKAVHRTTCQALTITRFSHSPYTTEIARIRFYTMLSTIINADTTLSLSPGLSVKAQPRCLNIFKEEEERRDTRRYKSPVVGMAIRQRQLKPRRLSVSFLSVRFFAYFSQTSKRKIFQTRFPNAPGCSQDSRVVHQLFSLTQLTKVERSMLKLESFVCLCNLKLTTYANSSHPNPQPHFTAKKTYLELTGPPLEQVKHLPVSERPRQ